MYAQYVRILSLLGYDTIIAVIVVKLWRIYYIFRISTGQKTVRAGNDLKWHYNYCFQNIQDWKLIIAVFIIVASDFTISVPLNVVSLLYNDIAPGFQTSSVNVSFRYSNSKICSYYSCNSLNQNICYVYKSMEISSYCLFAQFYPSLIVQSQDVLEEEYIYFCGATIIFSVFTAISSLYKIILHGVGLFLAFKTRKVEIDVLNDYKYIVAIICCSTIILVLISITILFVQDTSLSTLLWNCMVSSIGWVYLGFTFIPKASCRVCVLEMNLSSFQFIALYKDPQGEKIFNKTYTGSRSTTELKRVRSSAEL